jgi:hypothetical protein
MIGLDVTRKTKGFERPNVMHVQLAPLIDC